MVWTNGQAQLTLMRLQLRMAAHSRICCNAFHFKGLRITACFGRPFFLARFSFLAILNTSLRVRSCMTIRQSRVKTLCTQSTGPWNRMLP